MQNVIWHDHQKVGLEEDYRAQGAIWDRDMVWERKAKQKFHHRRSAAQYSETVTSGGLEEYFTEMVWQIFLMTKDDHLCCHPSLFLFLVCFRTEKTNMTIACNNDTNVSLYEPVDIWPRYWQTLPCYLIKDSFQIVGLHVEVEPMAVNCLEGRHHAVTSMAITRSRWRRNNCRHDVIMAMYPVFLHRW